VESQTNQALDEFAPNPVRSPEEIAYLQLTNGTTGLSKAVALSHQAVLNNIYAIVKRLSLTEADIAVNWAPFYHDLGLNSSLLRPLLVGYRSITLSPSYWIRHPHLLLRAIHQYRGTLTAMPNFGFNFCRQRIHDEQLTGLDLSCLRIAVNGAEPILWESMRLFAEWLAPHGFNPMALCAGYGMAENVVAITLSPLDRPLQVDWVAVESLTQGKAVPAQSRSQSFVSCGPPIVGTELCVVDEKGERLPARQIGEIALRGDALFSGYVGLPSETAATQRDGWFLTGDLGYLVDGELFVCGRKKDLIIVRGRNFHPEQIEGIAHTVLAEHGRRAVAFGIDDARLGTETPVVVCEYVGPPDDELRQQLARQIRQLTTTKLGVALSDVYFVAKGWVIHRDLKLARAANRDKYLAECPLAPALTGPVDAEQAALALVLAMFEAALGVAPVSADDNLFALGGDSLIAFRLVLRVEEEFGVSIPLEFYQQPTPSNLARIIQSQTAIVSANPPPVKLEPPDSSRKSPLAQTPVPSSRERRNSWQWYPRFPIESIAFLLPYHQGIRWLAWWCGLPQAQKLFYPKEIQHVRRFMQSVGCPSAVEGEQLQASLMGNIFFSHLNLHVRRGRYLETLLGLQNSPWLFWRDLSRALGDIGNGVEATCYFDLAGLDVLHRPGDGQQGIVMASYHSPLVHLGAVLLAQLGYVQHWVGWPVYQRTVQTLFPEQDPTKYRQHLPVVRAYQATLAHRILTKGGMVSLLSDEPDWSNGVPVTVGNRRFPLRAGMAEIALRAGAVICPLYPALQCDGRIKLTVLPPLDMGDASLNRHDRVEQIARQFATFLEDTWRREPATMRWPSIEQYLGYPRVKSDPE
jgi:acyl-CoA synthetase (AMP-forming)/AMP-acid ligase II/acyl carrier protein